MKTTVIITEKKAVSESLVRALAPDTYDNFGNTSTLHNDIVTVRKLSPGERADNSGNHYFNIQGAFPYQMKAEHIDGMGHKSAKRIRQKMKYINEHILTDLEKPILEVISNGCSIDDICSAIEGKDYPQIDMLDSDTESLHGAVARTLESLEQKGKIVSRSKLYFPNEESEEFIYGQSENITVPEDINYFVFERNGSLVIVIDTYGTPLKYRQAVKGYLQRTVCESADWKDLKQKIRLEPSFQDFNPRELKSHVVRMFLLNNILAKKRLPCDYNGMKLGQPIQLERVIAATDFDIAGSYIFLSVIESANDFARKLGEKPITTDMLYRMNMLTVEPADIQKSFDNPGGFDWENAYAGKARSVFDFLYGTSISNQLRHFNQDPGLKLSTGRTLFLGLKKIIEQEKALREETKKDYVYIAFEGLLDLNGINSAITNNRYTLMHIKQKRNYVSHPTFLELCKEGEIGTHTTRYKLAGRLERLGVLSVIDNRLFSTPYGNAFYNVLSTHLDFSPFFSITQWNANLQKVIASWRTDTNDNKPRTKDEMEAEFHKFMQIFLPSLQRQFRYLNSDRYAEIDQELSEAHQCLKRFEFSQLDKKKEYKSPPNVFLLVGNDSTLTLDDIKELIDPTSNTPRQGARSRIIRVIPQEPVSLVNYVRKIFNINRDYDFSVASSYNSNALIGMGNENHTAFRTEIPDGMTLKDFLNEGINIDEYEECELDESNFEEEGKQTAHEALMVQDIKRSDIAGRDGLYLAEEYPKPWYHTHDKLKKRANGQINVAGFKSRNHEFERIERYRFGVMHNFESLLAAMLDKYNIPFWRTAKLAEEMYLNAGK